MLQNDDAHPTGSAVADIGAGLERTARGTYVLLLHLPQSNAITIGKRGRQEFPSGYYAYVGSALGPGGLAGRLRHHLRPSPRPHWHIDHLRRLAGVVAIWYAASPTRQEHDWAALLPRLPGVSIPLAGFGASDCTCVSHLFYYPRPPSFRLFQALLAARFPEPVPLRAVAVRT
jgi:Uri superfamily endonuclease